MRGNTLTDNAASSILDALITNKNLKKLNLVMNPISYKYMNEIQKLINYHQQKQFKELKPQILRKIDALKVYESQKGEVFRKLEDIEEEKTQLNDDYKVTQQETGDTKEEERKISEEIDTELTDTIKEYRRYEDIRHQIEEEMQSVRLQIKSTTEMKHREINDIGDKLVKGQQEYTGNFFRLFFFNE